MRCSSTVIGAIGARSTVRASCWTRGRRPGRCWYDGCDFGPQPGGYEQRTGDIRDVTPDDLEGFDAVIHLAAISNDPIGHLHPQATYGVNAHGTVHIASMAKAAGVPRFLSSSSCLSMARPETSPSTRPPIQPGDAVRRKQAMAEAGLAKLADDNFSPTYCVTPPHTDPRRGCGPTSCQQPDGNRLHSRQCASSVGRCPRRWCTSKTSLERS